MPRTNQPTRQYMESFDRKCLNVVCADSVSIYYTDRWRISFRLDFHSQSLQSHSSSFHILTNRIHIYPLFLFVTCLGNSIRCFHLPATLLCIQSCLLELCPISDPVQGILEESTPHLIPPSTTAGIQTNKTSTSTNKH